MSNWRKPRKSNAEGVFPFLVASPVRCITIRFPDELFVMYCSWYLVGISRTSNELSTHNFPVTQNEPLSFSHWLDRAPISISPICWLIVFSLSVFPKDIWLILVFDTNVCLLAKCTPPSHRNADTNPSTTSESNLIRQTRTPHGESLDFLPPFQWHSNHHSERPNSQS